MARPTRFEEFRWLGDRETQRVYDLDGEVDESLIERLVTTNRATVFSPDTLAEARNRGYRLAKT